MNNNTVDIVTGRVLSQIYFDPFKILEKDIKLNSDFLGNNLYIPAGVMSRDNDKGIYVVKLPNGELYSIPKKDAQVVNRQDEEGVNDIIELQDFSEMSLIHSLRIRYERNEIYTSVGPILISINPYKQFDGLYSEDRMIEYHNQHKKNLPSSPHLFKIAEAAYNSLMSSFETKSPTHIALACMGNNLSNI